MSASFRPKLRALAAAQRAVWPALSDVPLRFVLYGGTALALRLGHRESERLRKDRRCRILDRAIAV